MTDEDEADLAASLSGLSGLVVGASALEDTLTRVAQFSVQAIPDAEAAGLMLFEQDRPTTVVSTSDIVERLESLQYDLGEGPCLTAAARSSTVASGSLGGDPEWPRFGPRAGRLGVHSVLSLPLRLEDRVLGAINVYARRRGAFGAAAVRLGEAFAVPAAVSVSNAQALAQAERLVDQLQRALLSRAEIDQALGVVMSRSGVGADEAFARLRAMSQARSVKLVDVARELLAESVRTARARQRSRGTRPYSAEPGA